MKYSNNITLITAISLSSKPGLFLCLPRKLGLGLKLLLEPIKPNEMLFVILSYTNTVPVFNILRLWFGLISP